MDVSARRALLDLNRTFYRREVDSFDAKRQSPWRGWERLLPLLDGQEAPLRVLDLGCGNGRFGRFLADRLRVPPSYTGADASPELLERARQDLPSGSRLIRMELGEGQLPASLREGSYSLVAVFGLLHHLPGFAARAALLRNAAARIAPGGLLAITFWQWTGDSRLRRRVEPWSRAAEIVGRALDPGELEPGDHLLRWGEDPSALRYCHHFSDEEVERLATATGYPIVADYRAERDLNRYLVLRALEGGSG